MSISEPKIEIVLCIPGPWVDRSQLVKRIGRDSGGYNFAGVILLNSETNDNFELQLEGHDPRMYEAFQAAGPHWKTTPEMDRIASHKSVVYLISNGGSVESAHSIMEAANGLLKAGGFAVKVESTGLAHPPTDWNEQCKYNYLFKSHASYVVYITSSMLVYSCGMHNFGLHDAAVEPSESENPVELLRVFTHYLLSESPDIKNGHTFSVAADEPKYRILECPSIDYAENSLFNNPFGTWKLETC